MKAIAVEEQILLALVEAPPSGLLAKAAFAGDLVVEHRLPEAQEIVRELETSEEGIAALIETLQDQLRSGWYRSMWQLFDSLKPATVESHLELFEKIVHDSVPRMIDLRVASILRAFSDTVLQKFPMLVSALDNAMVGYDPDQGGMTAPRPKTDELIHNLRGLSGAENFNEALKSLSPEAVSEAFEDFVKRGMYSWANELIAFTSSVSACRTFFLSDRGLPVLVQSIIRSDDWVSFRHLARVVLIDSELNSCFRNATIHRD